jgi:hypothetical protein
MIAHDVIKAFLRVTWLRTSAYLFRRCIAGFLPLQILKSVHCSIASKTPISSGSLLPWLASIFNDNAMNLETAIATPNFL